MENVVNSMPDNLLSTFQLDQTDVNNITISLTGVEKSGGKYVQSTLADITITPATNTVAGLMTGAESQPLMKLFLMQLMMKGCKRECSERTQS